MIDITQDEDLTRLDKLEREVIELRRLLTQTAHKANKASEDFGRSQFPVVGQTIYRCQVTANASYRVGQTIGRCTVTLTRLMSDSKIYRLNPNVTVSNVANDVSQEPAINSPGWITLVDGQWSLMLDDCVGTSFSAFPTYGSLTGGNPNPTFTATDSEGD